jgi:hypothetical protein
LANSGENKAFDADYAWFVKKEKLAVKNVSFADLGDGGVRRRVIYSKAGFRWKQRTDKSLCMWPIKNNKLTSR